MGRKVQTPSKPHTRTKIPPSIVAMKGNKGRVAGQRRESGATGAGASCSSPAQQLITSSARKRAKREASGDEDREQVTPCKPAPKKMFVQDPATCPAEDEGRGGLAGATTSMDENSPRRAKLGNIFFSPMHKPLRRQSTGEAALESGDSDGEDSAGEPRRPPETHDGAGPASAADDDLDLEREQHLEEGASEEEGSDIGDENAPPPDEEMSSCSEEEEEGAEGSAGAEAAAEAEDKFEEEEFDPYLFMKKLPALEDCVLPPRPLLLPAKTRTAPRVTLVLDLDETLVHSTLEEVAAAEHTFPVYFNNQESLVRMRRRPGLDEFMRRVAKQFEVVVFTASQRVYAEKVLNLLDPQRHLIRHRIFRDSCVYVEGNYLKDLSVLNRDLRHVVIVDNSPQVFGFQLDNGIPIESWFDDAADGELLHLLPFLERLVDVEDVRPLVASQFRIRDKIARAGTVGYSLGDTKWDYS